VTKAFSQDVKNATLSAAKSLIECYRERDEDSNHAVRDLAEPDASGV